MRKESIESRYLGDFGTRANLVINELAEEVAQGATEEWQTLRTIVPNFPAVSKSPREVAKLIRKARPGVQTRKSKVEMGVIDIRVKPE